MKSETTLTANIRRGWVMVAETADAMRWEPGEIMPTIEQAMDYAENLSPRRSDGAIRMSNDIVIPTTPPCVVIVLRLPANPHGSQGVIWIGLQSEAEDLRSRELEGMVPFWLKLPPSEAN